MLTRIFGGMQALCKDDPEKSILRTAMRQRPIRPCTNGRNRGLTLLGNFRSPILQRHSSNGSGGSDTKAEFGCPVSMEHCKTGHGRFNVKRNSCLPVCPGSLPESDHALPDQHDSEDHDHDDRDAHPLAANVLGGRLGAATVMTKSSPRR